MRLPALALTTAAVTLIAASATFGRVPEREQSPGDPTTSHAIEFSPASPFIRIYAAQYARRVGDKDEILTGFAYANIKYDHGRSHAPTAIVGYRRYVWRAIHVEYQLWLSYNWYYETDERRYREGEVFMAPTVFVGWRF